MKKNFLVTGRPGIGKTTLVLRVCEALRRNGVVVGGMVSSEERVAGRRTGFIIKDLITGKQGYLAKAGPGPGPRVGRYHVVLSDLNSIGVGAIRRAIREAEVIVIDEIGPMELYSQEFKDTVVSALDLQKPVLATIHIRANRYPYTRAILARPDVRTYTVTLANRNTLPSVLTKEILTAMGNIRGEIGAGG